MIMVTKNESDTRNSEQPTNFIKFMAENGMKKNRFVSFRCVTASDNTDSVYIRMHFFIFFDVVAIKNRHLCLLKNNFSNWLNFMNFICFACALSPKIHICIQHRAYTDTFWTQLIGPKLCIYDKYRILKMSSTTHFYGFVFVSLFL